MDLSVPISMNWRSTALAMLALGCLIMLAYLWGRDIERRAVAWLSAFVAASLVSVIPMIIGFAGAYDRWPGLTFLPTQLYLFYGPFFYLHAHALMVGTPLGWRKWLLVPGVSYWFYQVWAFTFLGDYKSKWDYNDKVHEPVVVPIVVMGSVGLGVWALAKVWRMRRSYIGWLQNERSDDDRFDPTWVATLVLIGVPLAVIWTSQDPLSRFFGFDYFDQFWVDLAALSLVFLISIEALAKLQRPYPKIGSKDASTETSTPPPDQGRNWQAEGEAIRAAIEEKHWHLEPGFSLQDLSRRHGMNQTYVSRALNQGLGQSFSHLINGLRVDAAKRMIAERQSTMLDIAMASGFGSKASFNRAFKLHTGQSPSAFQQSVSIPENSLHPGE